MAVGLPVSRLIDVTVTLTPELAKFPNFSTCLLLTTSDVIDLKQRMRSYDDLTAVAVDFGTNGPEYPAAQEWFAQTPAPDNLLIGRWAESGGAGELVGGAVSAANQLIAAWVGIANGGFAVTIDGVGPSQVGNLDFSAETNLNGVASVITSGFPGGTAICTWDALNQRFVITSQTTGIASTISFLGAPNAGTDISAMMAMRSTSPGAYTADGVGAQTALETVILFNDQFSSQWYGLVIPQAEDDDQLAVAGFIESAKPAHYYGINSQDSGTIVAGNTTCIAARVKAAGLNNTATQYSSTSGYAIMSYLSRILTTDWQANSSTITLMYKNEPLVVAENLTSTQMDALLAKNCNVFVEYNNNTAIIQPGCSGSGQFTDAVIGAAWLAASVQNAAYNLLKGTTTKIPQTDAGMHQIATQMESVMAQAVVNGLLAPGVWNAQGVGIIKQGDYLPKGYYIYTPPIALQSEADRAQRKSVPYQILAKLGGAVHTVDVAISVES